MSKTQPLLSSFVKKSINGLAPTTSHSKRKTIMFTGIIYLRVACLLVVLEALLPCDSKSVSIFFDNGASFGNIDFRDEQDLVSSNNPPLIDLKQQSLRPGEIKPIVWDEERYPLVAPNLYEIGLPLSVTDGLLSYIDKNEILQHFKHLLGNNPIPQNQTAYTIIEEEMWKIWRPSAHYKSNMHCFAPNGETSYSSFLRALGDSGFDEVLQAIGDTLGMNDITAYDLAFVGLSHYKEPSFPRYKVTKSSAKAFNLIIPLILDPDSDHELEVYAPRKDFVGKYKYKYGAGILFGDNAVHAIAAQDHGHGIELVASIYFAEITEHNIDNIAGQVLNGHDSPGVEGTFQHRGKHWSKNHNTRLPFNRPTLSVLTAAGNRIEVPLLDLKEESLRPGEVKHIVWEHDGKIVSPNLYEVGIPPSFRDTLLSYMEERGLIDLYLDKLLADEPVPLDTYQELIVNNELWEIRRPSANWVSNFHWTAPNEEKSHDSFLRALGDSGFDQVLRGIGNTIGLSDIVTYHLTFMGLSFCKEGAFPHQDFTDTGAKAFNLIVPLVLEEDSDPELDVYAPDKAFVGHYKYKYQSGVLLGDDALHATAAADYGVGSKKMRLTATIYIAEVTEDNVDSIDNQFTQNYPPGGQYVFEHRGEHWSSTNDMSRLPSNESNITVEAIRDELYRVPLRKLKRQNLLPGEVKPILWDEDEYPSVVAPNLYEVGIPTSVQEALLSYLEVRDFVSLFSSELLSDEPVPCGTSRNTTRKNEIWEIRRPPEHYKSNMHWLAPNEGTAHDSFLRALGNSGFDQVLDGIGTTLGLNHILVYQVTFLGVSRCGEGSFPHYDFTETNSKAFNLIVPILLVPDSYPELDVFAPKKASVGQYKYEYGSAVLMGDDAYHATAALDYGKGTGMIRVMANLCLAEVTKDNVDNIAGHLNQHYPPNGNFIFEHRGEHWSSTNEINRLPTNGNINSPVKNSNENSNRLPLYELKDELLSPGEIKPISLKRDGFPLVSPNMYEVGIPLSFREVLLSYMEERGLIDLYSKLLGNEPMVIGSHEEVIRYNELWETRRPNARYKSNMHWVSPAEEKSHRSFLRALGDSGFDQVLTGIGKFLGLSDILVYQLSLIGVSYCNGGSFPHHDFTETQGKAFNLLIPLILVQDSAPELDVYPQDWTFIAQYKYKYGTGVLLGDDAVHATAALDYGVNSGKIRISASIYMAEVREDNIANIASHINQNYPPDAEYIFNHRGEHWSSTNQNNRLSNGFV